MITVDASVLIAHFDPTDSHHEDATRMLLRAAGETLVAHTVTVAEVLVGAARRGKARARLDDITALGVEVSARRPGEEPLRLAELRVSTGLRLPDCCVLLTALAHEGARLATFDRDLAGAAHRLGVRVLPEGGAD